MAEEKILKLTLTKKWFDMVKSGKKREEYRENKPYWKSRLANPVPGTNYYVFKGFTHVEFRNGYNSKVSPLKFKITDMIVGVGDPALGAPAGKNVIIIKFE